MLITNADDWGRSMPETDAALTCYRSGAVGSVTAMVFMEDSERAAEIATRTGINVGLHLNLTQEFTGAGVPAKLAIAQCRIARFLKQNKYALILYHPFLRAEFQFVYEAQTAEFARIYGKAPSHVDGHQHMHLCSNILLGRVLPKGCKVRRSFSFWPGEKSKANRMYRWMIDQHLARRHDITDYFFSLAQCLGTKKLSRVIELAKTWNVELMTHPVNQEELNFLLNPDWLKAKCGLHTGSYENI